MEIAWYFVQGNGALKLTTFLLAHCSNSFLENFVLAIVLGGIGVKRFDYLTVFVEFVFFHGACDVDHMHTRHVNYIERQDSTRRFRKSYI